MNKATKVVSLFKKKKAHYESPFKLNEGIGVQLSKTKSNVATIFSLAEHKTDKILIRGFSMLDETSGLIHKSYEEVLYLLLHHHQPNPQELVEFNKEIRQYMSADATISQLLFQINALESKPLILLQILLLSLAYEDKLNNTAIIAHAFVLVANIFNKYVGRALVTCRLDLGLIENLLYMIGKDYTNPVLVKHFSQMMIAWMELGLAPSAIATRVNASSRTDVISALVAGVGNMTGEKHTSARIKCLHLLKEINQALKESNLSPTKDAKLAKKIIHTKLQAILDKGQIVPGFGHRIFKNLDDNGIDPRISLVEEAINELYGEDNLLSIVTLMRELFAEGQLLKRNKPLILPPNSDLYWSAFLYHFFQDYQPKNTEAVASLFTVLTRTSGLLAHYEEQKQMGDTIRGWGCYQ